MSFSELGLSSWMLSALQSLKIKKPTPVQEACIPVILEGRDVLGCSETGSGKTCAFALPILQRLGEDPCGIFAVVFTPTRELAVQIAQQMRLLGGRIGARVATVVGGVGEVQQAIEIERRPHIVVGTPGRLAELVSRSVGNWRRVRFIVMDEADRVLAREQESVRKVVEKCGGKRQMLLFSATMTKGLEDIVEMSKGGGKGIFTFDERQRLFETVKGLEQRYLFMPPRLRLVYLAHLLKHELGEGDVIVFVSKCYTAELLSTSLSILGVGKVAALHSEMKQTERLNVLHKFKGKAVRVLIATDLASRGLDIPTIELVLNYNIPKRAATYVHRVGRTARAGKTGLALSFITPFDITLVHEIEDRIGHKLEKYNEINEKKAMEGLSAVLKAERVAKLKLQDIGFATRCELRHELGKEKALQKRKVGEAWDGKEMKKIKAASSFL